MVAYPDSSFLIPLYVKEEGSLSAKKYVLQQLEPLCFTPFHRLEVRSGLRLRAFRKENSLDEIQLALRQLDRDLIEGVLFHVPLNWSEILREAERLGAVHLAELGVRSGDLLHVASAVVLGASEFLTFDQRQTALARRAGLKARAWRSK